MVTRYKNLLFKEIIGFGALVIIFSLPGVIPAAYAEIFSGSGEGSGHSAYEIAKFSVLIANTFHLDPNYFISGYEPIKLILFFVMTLLMVRAFFLKKYSLSIMVFIILLSSFFISGLVAREFEWFRYLKYYPFRVADSIVPMFFWIGIVMFFQDRIFVYYNKFGPKTLLLFLLVPLMIGGSKVVIGLFEPVPHFELKPKAMFGELFRTEPRLSGYRVRERLKEWHSFLFQKETNDFEEMALWIKDNTPEDKIFIVPPWDLEFAIRAQRPQFVDFKIPVSNKIFEWEERIRILNKGKPVTGLREMWNELRENYPRLLSREIIHIKENYGAHFFISFSHWLYDFPIIYENNTYRLYRL